MTFLFHFISITKKNFLRQVNRKSYFGIFILVATFVTVLNVFVILIIILNAQRKHDIKQSPLQPFNEEVYVNLTREIVNKWMAFKNKTTIAYFCNHHVDSILPNNSKIVRINSNAFKEIKTTVSILHLHHNLISHIDEESFFELKNLITLRLDFNQLKKLNLTFSKENKLEKLYLNNNQIDSIGLDTFRYLKRLDTLDLSSNKIKQISTHTFTDLMFLKRLCLYDNKIDDFTSFTYLNEKSLIIFKENDRNKIETIFKSRIKAGLIKFYFMSGDSRNKLSCE